MYLHIGKNQIIKMKDIIGIFDIELKKTKEVIHIMERLKQNHQLIDVSEAMEKSLILVKEDKIEKGYLSNISPTTLAKRAQEDMY